MAAAAVDVQQATAAAQSDHMAAADGTATTWSPPQHATHPEADEILRQIEYYFGDENLPHDAHLLGMAGGDPNGLVKLSEVLSWRKMRRFKPQSAVREVLKQSQLVEVVDGKHVRRKTPLTEQITVIPKVNEDRCKMDKKLEQKPWLSKNMLKKTGFEPNVTEGPIAPHEYELDLEAFHPDNLITTRLENAVNRFCNKRKMHQETRAIFEKFVIFGGLEAGGPFSGGMDKKQLRRQGVDEDEIDRLTAHFSVSESVVDGIELEDNPTWVVDFEALAKAFLSSQLMSWFDWYDENQVKTAANVLRNFYNYLLLHNVCPEYEAQIKAARDVCSIAEAELPRLAELDRCLPGDFNVACSTLYEGSFAGIHRDMSSGEDWMQNGDNLGFDEKTARFVFKAGIAAYGDDDQIERANAAMREGVGLKSISEETLGLEVVGIEMASGHAQPLYAHLDGTVVRPVGRLHCVRWDVPFAPPEDLPKSVIKEKKNKKFTFLIEESILRCCYSGMKMEAVVKELSLGITWLDAIEATYPSFFTWLPNESIRDWKEPGPPKGWMNRQMGVEDQVVKHEGADGGEENDDQPD